MLNRVINWWLFRRRKFKPCVVYYDQMGITEMVLEDVATVWCNVAPNVDGGYSFDGRLVAIKVWSDIRERPPRS